MPACRFALAVTLLSVTALSATAGDWPQFRGPNGAAVAADTGLPVKWSTTENVRWKIDLPGRGVGNPVIANGHVFLTASSGWQQDRLHVLCYDVADGKKRWERQFWATGNTTSHQKTCMAGPTPVTDGKNVYALFATGDLFALDADGNLLWYRALVRDYPDITNQVGMAASPVLWRDTLFVPMENAGDSFVAGLDVRDGTNRWKARRKKDIIWTTPLVVPNGDGADVLFLSSKDLTAFDAATGKKMWEITDKEMSPVSSVAAGKDGTVLVPGAEFLLLRPGGAKPEVVWKTNKLKNTTYASPLIYQNRIYNYSSIGLTCARAADGKVLWQQRLKGPFSSSPVGADGKVYCVNEEGTVFVLEAGDEAKVLGENAMGEVILATPAVADGAIFLRSDQHLYCIAEKTKDSVGTKAPIPRD
jgi:outer membrane protein assembly factor BamB